MLKIYMLAVTFFLASCASGPQEISLRSGAPGFLVTCKSNNIGQCYLIAGEICQLKKFNIWNKAIDDGEILLTISCRD